MGKYKITTKRDRIMICQKFSISEGDLAEQLRDEIYKENMINGKPAEVSFNGWEITINTTTKKEEPQKKDTYKVTVTKDAHFLIKEEREGRDGRLGIIFDGYSVLVEPITKEEPLNIDTGDRIRNKKDGREYVIEQIIHSVTREQPFCRASEKTTAFAQTEIDISNAEEWEVL